MNTIWVAIAVVSLLGLAFGAILGYASRRLAVGDDPVVEKINEILPQNQCGRCGYPGCRPYAETISRNGGKISHCAPSGETVMLKIAELFSVEPQPLGGETQEITPARMMAVIGENNCIGCTRCVQACPIDTIVGATHAMHTIVSDLCTGCNLYVGPYPAHCISLQPVVETPDSWKWDLNTIPVRIIPVEYRV